MTLKQIKERTTSSVEQVEKWDNEGYEVVSIWNKNALPFILNQDKKGLDNYIKTELKNNPNLRFYISF